MLYVSTYVSISKIRSSLINSNEPSNEPQQVRHLGNRWTKILKIHLKEEEEEFTILESDGLVEDTIQIKDQPKSSLERLRFDLATVAEDAKLVNIPLSEIYGLEVNEDIVLNEL